MDDQTPVMVMLPMRLVRRCAGDDGAMLVGPEIHAACVTALKEPTQWLGDAEWREVFMLATMMWMSVDRNTPTAAEVNDWLTLWDGVLGA